MRGGECEVRASPADLYLAISLVSTGPDTGVLTVAVPTGLPVETVAIVLTFSVVEGAAQC